MIFFILFFLLSFFFVMKCAAFVFEEVFPCRVLESSYSVKRSLFLSTEHDLNPFCQTGEQNVVEHGVKPGQEKSADYHGGNHFHRRVHVSLGALSFQRGFEFCDA
jgi:hypothetical protein